MVNDKDMDIDGLLDKYFEGATSAAEEARLRAFFASDDVPERLAVYKPIFAYFGEEIAKQSAPSVEQHRVVVAKRPLSRRVVFYAVSGIAACILLVLGIGRLLNPLDPRFCADNYVVINGRCYTDIHKVRAFAIEALQEVATPAEMYFPDDDGDNFPREIVNNQLQELGSLFSDDE